MWLRIGKRFRVAGALRNFGTMSGMQPIRRYDFANCHLHPIRLLTHLQPVCGNTHGRTKVPGHKKCYFAAELRCEFQTLVIFLGDL